MAAAVLVPGLRRSAARSPSRPVAPVRPLPGFRDHADRIDRRDRRPGRSGIPTRPAVWVPATVPPVARSGRSVFWRRRLAVALLLVLLGVGTVEVVGWGAGLVAARRPAPVTSIAGAGTVSSLPAVYVVEPGDTLWSIAARLDPHGDPRPVVDRLADRAGGAAIRPGQRLRLDGL